MTVNNLLTFLTLVLFAVSVISIQNKYCQLPCDYIFTVFSNTVCDRENEKCGPAEQCGPDFKEIQLSNSQRQNILDLHNEFRNQVATGNETRGDQPPATNMNILTYSRELEFIAQCWANTCNGNPLIHDHCRRTSKFEHVGQNLGFINTSFPEIEVDNSITELTTLWYEEVDIFQNDWVNDTADRGPNFKVGHYTQMLWADTSEIGCAASFYTTFSSNTTWNHLVYVCNYGPGGNYLGLPVYDVGDPCSKCPSNMKQNEEYLGLCGNSRKVEEDADKFNNLFELD